MRQWRALLGACAVALAVASACSSAKGGGAAASSTLPSSSTVPLSPTVPENVPLYVSIGDSYAAGYQPDKGNNRAGFAYQVADRLAAQGAPLQLVNFACSGATTASILERAGCDSLGPGAPAYPDQTQVGAVQRFLAEHPGQVKLITVSIGGNDVTACATQADPVGCVSQAVTALKANLATLLADLRQAAGPATRIIGITYPDVVLGGYLSGDPAQQQLAMLSIDAFKLVINPALQQAYEAAGATFIDVTEATGAYGSFAETTTLAPYGAIPAPVAKVCQLTYICSKRDIHPTDEGYSLIADLVLGAYSRQ